jgi:hypothetical protein
MSQSHNFTCSGTLSPAGRHESELSCIIVLISFKYTSRWARSDCANTQTFAPCSSALSLTRDAPMATDADSKTSENTYRSAFGTSSSSPLIKSNGNVSNLSDKFWSLAYLLGASESSCQRWQSWPAPELTNGPLRIKITFQREGSSPRGWPHLSGKKISPRSIDNIHWRRYSQAVRGRCSSCRRPSQRYLVYLCSGDLQCRGYVCNP